MQTEEKKDKGTKGQFADLRCCNPEDFRKMFEKICTCVTDQSDGVDFCTMKTDMMRKMMEMYCGSQAEKTKTNTEPEKEP